MKEFKKKEGKRKGKGREKEGKSWQGGMKIKINQGKERRNRGKQFKPK